MTNNVYSQSLQELLDYSNHLAGQVELYQLAPFHWIANLEK